MKNVFLTAFVVARVLIATLPAIAQDVSPVLSPQHYKLRFILDPEHHGLSAEANITVRNSADVAISTVPVLLYRLMDVESATDVQGKPLPFTQKVVKFPDDPVWQINYAEVTLTSPLAPKQAATIHLKYGGQLHGYREAWQYVRDTISEEYSLLRMETLAYPIIAPPTQAGRRGSWRYKFDYEIDTIVPAGFVAVCSGKEMGETKTGDGQSSFDCSGDPDSLPISVAVAKFRVLNDTQGNLRVYAMPADASDGDRIMGEMRRSLDFYRSYFGNVPGGGLTLIEIPEGWGSYATTGHIFQTAAAFKDKDDAGELWHEVAHRWNVCSWGPDCSHRVQRTRYFDEAFAMYFQALATRQFQGVEAYRKLMQRLRESFTKRATRDPLGRTTAIADYGRDELGDFSYTKGAWSLYVLHQILGEDAFRRSISEFLAGYMGKPVEFDDLRRSLEKSSGRDLQAWFQQWILSGPESSALLMEGKSVEEIAALCKAK